MQLDEKRLTSQRAGDDPDRAAAHDRRGLRERIGAAIGVLWAPAIGVISRARRARMFHPVGLTFTGHCDPIHGPAFPRLADRLDGRVLVRCSGALWRHPREYLEVLGIALRLRRGRGAELDVTAAPGDQDLLFATIRSPWTMPLAPFTTDARDFINNRYWAVSPFAIHDAEHQRVELRLSPTEPQPDGGTRNDRLRAAVAAGRAAWVLEARRTLTLSWFPVARITLDHEIELDQEALRFDPFRAGAGVEPVGLVHAIRRAVYAASQRARPSHREG